ncbi:hemolysin family protein, partial [Chloroflexota bacterium]
MTTFLIPILIISLLIVLNGIFVAAEFAIVVAPRPRITQLADNGNKTAQKVLNILNNPDLQNRYITTAQVGITIVSLGLGMYGESVMAGWLENLLHHLEVLAEPTAHSIATITSVGLLTYLHVVIGEMIPKSLALQASEKTAIMLNRPMLAVEKIFYPLVHLLNFLGISIMKLIGIPDVDSMSRLLTPEELEYIVEESFESGLLEPSDQLFIENILDLEERIVAQAMTPRNHICGIPNTADRNIAMKTICETTKTRYVIFEENLDKVVGILHIKDLARHLVRYPDNTDINLRELARPPIYVPETLPLDDLLIRFRTEHHQIAIVFDEFGGTSGIITLEDLIEEVVGEIQDEFDQETQPIEEVSPSVLRVRGDVILDELQQLYKLDLYYEEANTIGGLVMAELGRIPLPKDCIIFNGIKIEVTSVEKLAVEYVLIYLPEITSDQSHS